MVEILRNNPSTTLNGAINSTVTSLIVTSATGFPTTGDFRIRIDNEIILVTSVSGTTFTVIRAVEEYQGTQTAVSHSNGAAVTLVLSQHGLSDFIQVETGGITMGSLGTPATPTVTPQGTTGATTWTYKIVAKNASGNSTAAGSAGSTSTGNATLTSSNFNRITWIELNRATSYDIYRTVAGGTPSTIGKIGNTSNTTFDDTGLAGDSATAPSVDKSYYSGVNTATPGVEWDVTGSGRYSVGLVVGFAGTPSADIIQIGDSNFYIDFNITAIGPGINFDSGDYLQYDRATNTFTILTGSSSRFSLNSSGVNIFQGLRVGFSGNPAAITRLEVTDSTFYLEVQSGVSTILLDTGDYFSYTRSTNTLEFLIGANTLWKSTSSDFDSIAAYKGMSVDYNTVSSDSFGMLWYQGNNSVARAYYVFMDMNAQAFRVVGNTTGSEVEWANISDTSGWAAASGSPFKDNIKTITQQQLNYLFKSIINVPLRTYRRRDDVTQSLEFGILAEEILPEILSAKNKEFIQPVKWLGVLTALVQSLAVRVARLEGNPIVWEAELKLRVTAGMMGRARGLFDTRQRFISSNEMIPDHFFYGEMFFDSLSNIGLDGINDLNRNVELVIATLEFGPDANVDVEPTMTFDSKSGIDNE